MTVRELDQIEERIEELQDRIDSTDDEDLWEELCDELDDLEQILHERQMGL